MSLSDECLLDELDDLIPLPKEKEPGFPAGGWNMHGTYNVGTPTEDLKSYKYNLYQDLGGIEKFKEQYECAFAINMDRLTNDTGVTSVAYPIDNSLAVTKSYVGSNISVESVKSITDEITQNVLKEMTSKLDNEIMEQVERVDMSLMNTFSTERDYTTGYGMTASQVSAHSHDINSVPSMMGHDLSGNRYTLSINSPPSYQPSVVNIQPADSSGDIIVISAQGCEIKINESGNVTLSNPDINLSAKVFWQGVSNLVGKDYQTRKNLEAEVERLKAEVVTLKAQQLPTSMKLVNPLKEKTAAEHEVSDLINTLINTPIALGISAAKEHVNSIWGDLVGVQPMTNSTGSIFNIRYSYDDNISKFDHAMELVK